MSALKNAVTEATLEQVQVVYLDRTTAKWWNAKRQDDDTRAFCGWFWIRGSDEAGPFRTRSSAVRDAYYRYVLQREVPSVGHSMLPSRQAKVRRAARRADDMHDAAEAVS